MLHVPHGENMQPINYSQNDRQQLVVQDNLVRVLGRFLGRIISTIAAAAGARYYHENYVDTQAPEPQVEQANVAQHEQIRIRMSHALRHTRRDATVAAATVVAWNTEIGANIGADVCEYIVNRISNFTAHDMGNTAYLPSGPAAVADRVADSLLWRFGAYAADKFPQVRDIFQPSQSRHDGFRYRY